VNNVIWVTGVSSILLTLVSIVVLKGIKLTSYAQVMLTVIEGIILLAVIIKGFLFFSTNPIHPFSWQWFNPMNMDLKTFVDASVVSIFFYFWWDVAMNLAEETKNPGLTPGRAAFWSMIFLITFFLVFMTLVLFWLTDAEIKQYNTNVIFAVAEKVLGKWLGYTAILAVLLSTIGTMETQMIQFTRTLFVKSRESMVPWWFWKLHTTWQTPYVAVGTIWLIWLLLILISWFLPSVNSILQTSIETIGYQVSFYLGLSAFAATWRFRKRIIETPIIALTEVWWPFFLDYFLLLYFLYDSYIRYYD